MCVALYLTSTHSPTIFAMRSYSHYKADSKYLIFCCGPAQTRLDPSNYLNLQTRIQISFFKSKYLFQPVGLLCCLYLNFNYSLLIFPLEKYCVVRQKKCWLLWAGSFLKELIETFGGFVYIFQWLAGLCWYSVRQKIILLVMQKLRDNLTTTPRG